jgi:hypothetical protein
VDYAVDFRYANILKQVRDYPGNWACIAIFQKGSPRTTQKQVTYAIVSIKRHLTRYYPLEDWEAVRRTPTDTYSRRELWVRFNGLLSPEEMAERRAAKRAEWDEKRAKGQLTRANKLTKLMVEGLKAEQEIRTYSADQRRMANGR